MVFWVPMNDCFWMTIQRNFSMVVAKHRMNQPGILWLYQESNDIFKVNNNINHHFTVKGCNFRRTLENCLKKGFRSKIGFFIKFSTKLTLKLPKSKYQKDKVAFLTTRFLKLDDVSNLNLQLTSSHEHKF